MISSFFLALVTLTLLAVVVQNLFALYNYYKLSNYKDATKASVSSTLNQHYKQKIKIRPVEMLNSKSLIIGNRYYSGAETNYSAGPAANTGKIIPIKKAGNKDISIE